MSLGKGVTLTGPDYVVAMMKEEIDRLVEQYRK